MFETLILVALILLTIPWMLGAFGGTPSGTKVAIWVVALLLVVIWALTDQK